MHCKCTEPSRQVYLNVHIVQSHLLRMKPLRYTVYHVSQATLHCLWSRPSPNILPHTHTYSPCSTLQYNYVRHLVSMWSSLTFMQFYMILTFAWMTMVDWSLCLLSLRGCHLAEASPCCVSYFPKSSTTTSNDTALPRPNRKWRPE